jgi:hypothetical protein
MRAPAESLLAAWAATAAALALASCSGEPGGGAAAANQAGAAVRTAPSVAPPPCPEEELSCGKQTPAVSDGTRRFVNEEMGLSVLFPAGSRVCMARSGDAPRGFYAWYGTDAPGCPERGDIEAVRMTLHGWWNALFHRDVGEAVGDWCKPPSPPIAKRLARRPLRFEGHESLVCEQPRPGGWTELHVIALAEPSPSPGEPPRAVYDASLQTRPERLDEDLESFRTFLAASRIGSPG